MSSPLKTIDTPPPLGPKFEDLGISVTTFSHKPVFTVNEGADVKAQLKGAHTKNLFIREKKKKRLFLVVACDDTKIDLNWLSKRLNVGRFSFGKPERLQEVLGVTPGSVTPFALINDTERLVTPIYDERMLGYDVLNFHPLVNSMTTAIGREDFLTFTRDLGYEITSMSFE